MDRIYKKNQAGVLLEPVIARKICLDMHGDLIDLTNNSYISFSGLKSNAMVKKISERYGSVLPISDYSNEIFINFFVKKCEWESLLLTSDIGRISDNKGCEGYIWNDIVNTRNNNIRASRFSGMLNWLYVPLFCFSALLFPMFCIFKSLLTRKLKPISGKNISVIRSQAAYDKILTVKDDLNLVLISEEMVYRNSEIDSMFSYVRPIPMLLAYRKVVIKSFRDLSNIKKELRGFLSGPCVHRILLYYASRIVLKCSYEVFLEEIIKVFKTNVVTGNKEDRFAMVEVKVAAKCGVLLTCIPHGLEYAFKFPGGLAGDLFYCTSSKSAFALRDIYSDEKFVFDERINNKIYGGHKSCIENRARDIIFFTEPRNIQVNRIIIKFLQDSSVAFRVKLHPADDRRNYPKSELEFVESLADALMCTIVIARKSTVLLDAMYRGADPISFLIDSKDDYYANYVFPSLSDVGIKKVYHIQDLLKFL